MRQQQALVQAKSHHEYRSQEVLKAAWPVSTPPPSGP